MLAVTIAALASASMWDADKPLVTRVGAIICPTRDAAVQVYSARDRGWTYVQLVGVPIPAGVHLGQPVSLETFGCRAARDGEPLKVIRFMVEPLPTDIGWVSQGDIRNEPPYQAPSAPEVHPTLCDAHGEHCVRTDLPSQAMTRKHRAVPTQN